MLEGNAYGFRKVTPSAYEHKISMTPSVCRRNYNDSANDQNDSPVIPKSSVFIQSNRTAVTPEKHRPSAKHEETVAIDSIKKNYFKQMSKELN
jgi:hypothetical protein